MGKGRPLRGFEQVSTVVNKPCSYVLDGLKGGPTQGQRSSLETVPTVWWSSWALKGLGLLAGMGKRDN